MSTKTFIMLAAPSMIGKSTATRLATQANPVVHVLENDILMQKLFGIVHLPRDLPIHKMDEWRTKVNVKADCDALIRLLHRDNVSSSYGKSVILAEGYTYMNHEYRQQVKSGLAHLEHQMDYLLLRYEPPMVKQVENRTKKYEKYKWNAISPERHEELLRAEWQNFQEPLPSEMLPFEVIRDNETLVARISHLIISSGNE